MNKKELAVQVSLGTTWSDKEIAAMVDWYFGTSEDYLAEQFDWSSDREHIEKTLGILDSSEDMENGENEPDQRFAKLLKEVRRTGLRDAVIEVVTRKIRGKK